MGYKDMEKVVKTATHLEGIQTSERLLWVVLAMHRNTETGQCFPSIETLMEETGLSRKGVQLGLKNLKKLRVVDIIPGGGRVSSHYNLLIHSEAKDKVQLFPVEDLDDVDNRLRGVVSTPQQRSEYASEVNSVRLSGVVSTPESGISTQSVEESESINRLPVTGQRASVTGSSDRETEHKELFPTHAMQASEVKHVETKQMIHPRGMPPETPKVANTDQSSSREIINKAQIVLNKWREVAPRKYASLEDCARLVKIGFEQSEEALRNLTNFITWIFTQSHHASESPNWKGGFDLANAAALLKCFRRLYSQWWKWSMKLMEAEEKRSEKKYKDDEEIDGILQGIKDRHAGEEPGFDNDGSGIFDDETETFDDDGIPIL